MIPLCRKKTTGPSKLYPFKYGQRRLRSCGHLPFADNLDWLNFSVFEITKVGSVFKG